MGLMAVVPEPNDHTHAELVCDRQFVNSCGSGFKFPPHSCWYWCEFMQCGAMQLQKANAARKCLHYRPAYHVSMRTATAMTPRYLPWTKQLFPSKKAYRSPAWSRIGPCSTDNCCTSVSLTPVSTPVFCLCNAAVERWCVQGLLQQGSTPSRQLLQR